MTYLRYLLLGFATFRHDDIVAIVSNPRTNRSRRGLADGNSYGRSMEGKTR
jgi:hypothetical protein